jgi:hypothetical protein
MFQVMWVKVMEGLTRPGGLVALTFPALEHIVDLEADVIDLRVPLCWHCLWEGPGGKRGSTDSATPTQKISAAHINN